MKPPNKTLEIISCILLGLVSAFSCNSTANLNPEGEHNSEFKNVTPDVESPFILEDNIVDLDLSSYYCRQTTSFGKICDYSETNKTIRLPVGLKYSLEMPSFIELKVLNAAALHIYPTCISWVQAMKVRYLSTFPPDKLSNKQPEDCRTWLRIYDSSVDEISYGVVDVTLMNSKVSKINLKNQRDIMTFNSTIDHIEWLDWKGYKGHIANTTINKITKFIANSDLIVVNSRIGILEHDAVTLNNSENQFYDTNINIIHSNGLKFLGRNSELKNVTIRKLHKYAITTGLIAGLSMSNVHILEADAPAFFFYFPELIKIENVTIEGEPLKIDSKWIETAAEESKKLPIDTNHCLAEENSVICNMKNFEIHQLSLDFDVFKPSFSAKNLTIKNANLAEIINHPCNLSLTLIRCNVSGLLHSKPKKSNEKCQSALKARSCNFGYIESSNFNILDFENVKIKSLNASQISYMHFKYSEINEVESLITREDSRACIQYTSLGKIGYAIFNEPLKMEHSHISSIFGNLTINHRDESSLFLNSSIDYIGFRGLYVLSGDLQINDVKIKHMQEQSIFLEQNTHLFINNSFSFPRLGLKSISVVNYEQASINIPSLPIKTTDWMFYIRQPESKVKESSNEKYFLGNSTVTSNSYCEKRSENLLPVLKCNFQNMEVEVEIPFPVHLTLKNISYLTLHPSCLSMIYLNDVLNGTILSPDSMSCKTIIHMQSSNIHEMRGGTKDFFANASHIENVVLTDEPFENILILNSTISSIEGVEYSRINEISQSTIDSVHMMNGLHGSELWVFESHIGLIDMFGVTIEKGFVFNSVIDHILFYGVTVNGEVNITNTTVGHVDHEAIIIEGVLNLQNVVIQNGSLDSFLLAEGDLKCQNVTINGHQIHSRDIIFTEKTTLEIADPKDKNDKMTTEKYANKNDNSGIHPPVTQPPVVIPEKHFPPTSTNFDNKREDKYSNSRSNDQSNASFSWLFGVLGFFIGVAITFGIAYLYFLLRPDVQNLTPSIRWKVTDDEHDLIHSDDDIAGERIL